jgi:N-acetylglucosaminyldiphosphoundecaprenol N-acetyl-beta-D-mannosaminyltransferase
MSMGEALPTVSVHGVAFHAVTQAQCVAEVMRALDAGQGGRVATLNLDQLRRASRDASFAALCRRASLVVADGMPLVWASRLQGTPLPQRVAGSDLIGSLCAAAAQHGRSVFLLGGAPGTAERAAQVLRARDPGLRVAGVACPAPGFEADERRLRELAEGLRAARPDVVFLGLGAPKQDALAERLGAVLPAAWWVGVGISFSFVSGALARAPGWMQRSGLEWLHRLGAEPRRLSRRYLLEGVPFACGLLASSALRRGARAGDRRR